MVTEHTARILAYPSTKKILLMEDDVVYQKVMAITFKRLVGVKIMCVNNGSDGIALALTERPDLVLIDWFMDGTASVGVISRLRQEKSLEKTPIVVYTAALEDAIRKEALSAGATEYLQKPLSVEKIAGLTTRYLLNG